MLLTKRNGSSIILATEFQFRFIKKTRYLMSEQTAHTTTGAYQTLPLIVIDGAVVFPYTVASLPLDEQTAPAAEAALKDGRLVLLAARREDADAETPLALQLHRTGVVARIEQ